MANDFHHVWDEEEELTAPVQKATVENIIEAKKKIEGRFILYRNLCPMCGGRCAVKTKTRGGHPLLYCKTNKKYIECIYVDV